jgi:hypothetical protein
MVSSDHPPPFCGAYDPPPIVPLILHVSPPPGLSDLEEFYYDSGTFVIAGTFFLAHGHQVTMLVCPDLDAFTAMSPGTVVRPISALPTLVVLEGGQLLIDQAAACLMSPVKVLPLGIALLPQFPGCSFTAIGTLFVICGGPPLLN